MSGSVRVGVGGWTFKPWRGVFYPEGLPQKHELAFASRALSSIEINGTYYSTFKSASWEKWRDETPDDFVFSVKASRYCTNRKRLAGAAPSIARFLGQGLTQLGTKLGPINWQFMPTKKFDAEDFEAFLGLLPRNLGGLALRHAVEVRHPSFATRAFYEIARKHRVAIVYAAGGEYPEIDQPTADFTYARLMSTLEKPDKGVTPQELSSYTHKIRAWSERGDVFVYFISGAKARNPAAARALLERLGSGTERSRRRVGV